MPDLSNSQRRLYKSTYQPIQIDAQHSSSDDMRLHASTMRALDKMNFVHSLGVYPSELAGIEAEIVNDTQLAGGLALTPVERNQVLGVFHLVEAIVYDPSPTTVSVRYSPKLMKVDSQALVNFGQVVARQRHRVSDKVDSAILAIRTNFSKASSQPVQPNQDVVMNRQPMRQQNSSSVLWHPSTTTNSKIQTLEDAIDWAVVNDRDNSETLSVLAHSLSPINPIYSNLSMAETITSLIPKTQAWVDDTDKNLQGFIERMKIEPVGRLNLERIETTPAGMEKGELAYSVPLAPKEVITISHKEWATNSSEFTDFISDSFESFSEQGVAEKDDISRATDSQSAHASALNVNASAEGFGCTISTAFSYNANQQQAQKDSRNHSISITRQASARTKKEHKYSVRISSVTGEEDANARVIRNPSEANALRLDYYQLIRKWKCELFQYDLRMTYDIVIPNPGAALAARILEIYELDKQIDEEQFVFDVHISNIQPVPFTDDPNTWGYYAKKYNVSNVDPIPELQVEKMEHHKSQDFSSTDVTIYDSFEFQVDPDYEIVAMHHETNFDCYSDHGPVIFDIFEDDHAPLVLNNQLGGAFQGGFPKFVRSGNTPGLTGKVGITYSSIHLFTASIDVYYTLGLKQSVIDQWRYKTWSAIRNGAEAMFNNEKEKLRQKRAKLAEQIAAQDALTLRKMEREEIMKGVLRWLFGPTFFFEPLDIQDILSYIDPRDPSVRDPRDPHSLTNDEWRRLMVFGEFIKYIHNAIEWENVIFLTYPYFWDEVNGQAKLFMDHPDPRHRDFLRASSARVVLTIRPGFEGSFAALIEMGDFGQQLPPDHPYVKIADEIRHEADTNYPGIPPANPETGQTDQDVDKNVAKKEHGILIARWYEYTPTSALDISMNTVLSEMA